MFTVNGEYLVGGTNKDVRVWRAADGKQVATMPVERRMLPLETARGQRKAKYKQVFADTYSFIETDYDVFIKDVDFSPGSSRLVSADDSLNTATIWNIAVRHSILSYPARCRKVRKLNHDEPVRVEVYSVRDRVCD